MNYERIELDRKLEEMAKCIGDFKRDYTTSTPSSQVVSPRPDKETTLGGLINGTKKVQRSRNDPKVMKI